MCKPAVPRCGHAACFWCVHRAMDHFCASACPTCRRPFEHLPDVCVPLHRFLARAFPVEYARRLRETHEEEETKECFSPSPALDLDLGALRLTDKKTTTTTTTTQRTRLRSRSSTRSSALRRCAARTIPCSSACFCAGSVTTARTVRTRNTRRNTRGAGTRRATRWF